ncbi:MAG: patatin like phospholipase [Myxococcales bacterium]|nr:patatin like phospholipase [Myxococcales bacterium]
MPLRTRAVVPPNGRGRVALVLAGGAARGAYEVGVVQHILEDVARDLGRDPPLDILCGTSVGALNTCGLAAFADYPRARARRLVDVWSHLTIDQVLSIDRGELFGLMRALVGRPPAIRPDAQHGVGLVDPTAIEKLITDAVPFARIQQHLDAGLLSAVTVTATHIGSGRTIVFIAQKNALSDGWSTDPTMIGERVELQPVHALASAAIPVLFPAVRVGAEFYCDGGLRQNVPLSPARRLGADGIIVVSPRFLPLPQPDAPEIRANEEAFPGPLFLLGKTLNALLLDRLDSDIDRLRRINKILDAGTRSYGASFLSTINDAMGSPPGKLALRPLATVLVRASGDIGRMSGEFVRSASFNARNRGLLGRLMRRLADAEGASQADLLSYLLFDGEFARELIALGRADARRQHDELCSFFEDLAHRDGEPNS